MLKPLSFQLSCGGNEYIMCKNIFESESVAMQSDFVKASILWDAMHKLDSIAEDAVIREESPAMILKFMNEILQNDEEREYFLLAYRKEIYNSGWNAGHCYDYDCAQEYETECDYWDDIPNPNDFYEPTAGDIEEFKRQQEMLDAENAYLASQYEEAQKEEYDFINTVLNCEALQKVMQEHDYKVSIEHLVDDLLITSYECQWWDTKLCHSTANGGSVAYIKYDTDIKPLLVTECHGYTFEFRKYGDGLCIGIYLTRCSKTIESCWGVMYVEPGYDEELEEC